MRILLCTGAGMSADSGLPTYRGPHGRWTLLDGGDPRRVMVGQAYRDRPAELWERHHEALRRQLAVQPHAGHRAIVGWASDHDLFAVTSNVDGLLQRAGLREERVHEVHGSAHWVQCRDRCGQSPWPRAETATFGVPACPACGGVARLNLWLFDDRDVDPVRRMAGRRRLDAWRATGPVDLVVEVGAGSVLRTVRTLAERVARDDAAPLVRVNRDEAEVDRPGWLALTGTAAEVLPGLDPESVRGSAACMTR